jgi:hypothetical protein
MAVVRRQGSKEGIQWQTKREKNEAVKAAKNQAVARKAVARKAAANKAVVRKAVAVEARKVVVAAAPEGAVGNIGSDKGEFRLAFVI